MKLRSTSGRLRTAMAGIAVATSALLAIAGCGAGGSSEGAAGKLTVLVEGGGKAELQPIADAYQKETGTTV
jgi:ABC-type molybdate transport system substrate-binding protein